MKKFLKAAALRKAMKKERSFLSLFPALFMLTHLDIR